MKHVSITIIALFAFLFAGARLQSAYAGTLSFDPSSVNTAVDETFTLTVKVDAEDAEVLGVDALIEYDKDMLEITNIADGTFLSIGAKEHSEDGKAYVAGMVESAGESVTGAGDLVDITFKALSGGTTNVSFICELGETGESNISENSTDATDLIECSQNGEAVVVITGDGSTTSGGTSTSGGSSTPSQLPKTGVFENMVAIGIVAGAALVLVGISTKLLA
jgi:hypothetical protein